MPEGDIKKKRSGGRGQSRGGYARRPGRPPDPMNPVPNAPPSRTPPATTTLCPPGADDGVAGPVDVLKDLPRNLFVALSGLSAAGNASPLTTPIWNTVQSSTLGHFRARRLFSPMSKFPRWSDYSMIVRPWPTAVPHAAAIPEHIARCRVSQGNSHPCTAHSPSMVYGRLGASRPDDPDLKRFPAHSVQAFSTSVGTARFLYICGDFATLTSLP